MISSEHVIRFLLGFGLAGFTRLAMAGAPPPESYSTHRELTRELRSLSRSHRDLVRIHELAVSSQGREVWLMEIGHGEEAWRRSRPALLLVAGIEGNDLTGSASAAYWMHALAEGYHNDPEVKSTLDSTTIYVVPRLNPDALESYFKKPRIEYRTNFDPVDDDHDGLTDEDGRTDLNGDGLAAWMRVQDPEGEYRLDPTDSRVLIEADSLKGERGEWKLLPEGVDEDGDEEWNEDPAGGVNFNRNFPYGYRYFAEDAGRHPVSQTETRALADFVVAHPNIGIAFTFGSADNILQTPKGESNINRPPTAMQESDVAYLREFGGQWREALGLEKELSGSSEPGTFSDWMYFHRGRLSLAARAWSEELALAWMKDEEKAEAGRKASDEESAAAPDEGTDEASKPTASENGEEESEDTGKPKAESDSEAKKTKPDQRGEKERDLLKWAEKHAPEAFLPWTEHEHPDFPGQKVEIGGWAPFAKSVAPPGQLTNVVLRQAAFLTDLAGKLPRMGVRKVEVKPLGQSIYDITAQVENTGYLPTALAQGETTREVFPTRVELNVEDDLILGGTRRVMIDRLQGSGGMEEVRWVCRLPDRTTVEMTVHSMLGGTLRHIIPLENRQ